MLDFILSIPLFALGCLILNTAQMCIYSSTKINPPKIRLPKRKKFQIKETPIYEVFKTNDGSYAIRKWELDWDRDIYMLNVFLFPIMFEWYIWKYVERIEFFLCEEKDQLVNYTEDQIQTIWEDRYKEYKEEVEGWESEHTQESNNLDRLNTKFNKNYE
jgi:hypothetical protein